MNIILFCLGYIPGLLHAWYIIASNPEQDYDYEPVDDERGAARVTYYYVSHSQRGAGQHGQMNYGGATVRQQPKGHQQSRVVSATPGASGSGAPEIGSNGEQSVPSGDNAPPPPYADAVRGDHKVQTND